jgi:hypothetical protein
LYLFAGLVFVCTQIVNNQNLKEKSICLQDQYQTFSRQFQYDTLPDFLFKWPLSWLEKDLKYGINATSVIYTNPQPGLFWSTRLFILFALVILLLHYTKNWTKIVSISSKWYYSLLLFFPLAIGVIIQFFIALDWGRFIHIFFINFLAFFICFGWQQSERSKPFFPLSGWLLLVVSMISSFLWIPHVYLGGTLKKSYLEGMLEKFVSVIIS